MRLLFLVYDAVLDEEVTEVLDKCDRQGYTKWQRVLGRGERSEPRMDTPVWPGFNNAVVMAATSGQEAALRESLAPLVAGSGGLRLYALPVERLL